MAKKSMQSIAAKMKDLDICMMSTQTARGQVASRPMSNNGQVEYNGVSYFFTWEKGNLVKEIKADPQVNLSFSGPKRLYLSVSGKAKLVSKRSAMEEHWTDSLNQWFKKGLDTPGVIMIEVKAKSVRYWQDNEQGERTM